MKIIFFVDILEFFPKNTYFKEASFGRTVVKKKHRGKGYGHVIGRKESLKHLKN